MIDSYYNQERDTQHTDKIITTPLIALLVLGIFLSVLFKLFVKLFDDGFTTLKVQGPSMQPTYQPEEAISCLDYKNEYLQRESIVIFNHSTNQDGKKTLFKRIIAISNDEILFSNGLVFLNGKQLKESYATTPTNLWEGGFAQENKTIKILPNQYFVMGDNRIHSSDSREFGPINNKEITCYIKPIDKEKKDIMRQYTNNIEMNSIAVLQVNFLQNYDQNYDKQVNIDDVLQHSGRVKSAKYLLENKYKTIIKQDDYDSLLDKLNRQIIFCQSLINRLIVDRPLNDFITWEIISQLNNDVREILSNYTL